MGFVIALKTWSRNCRGCGRYTQLMSDPLHLTIVYEEGDDGWIVVSIPEVPGVLSQGRTKEEAREMALDALGGMLELRAAEHEPQGKSVGSESLNIVAA
jgi:predicted RNase H-like HicB family nuclease